MVLLTSYFSGPRPLPLKRSGRVRLTPLLASCPGSHDSLTVLSDRYPCRRNVLGRTSLAAARRSLNPSGAQELEELAAVLLGLGRTPAEVGSMVDLHDQLLEGLSSATVKRLRGRLHEMRDDPNLLSALGLAMLDTNSSRKRMTPLQGNFAWTFARLLVRATHVLGNQSSAERWISEPVMALNRRSPLELMTTSAGAQAVDDQLTRMELGVYA